MAYRAYKIETPNKDLPVPLEEVKQYLKMDDLAQDDSNIQAMVMSVVASIEKEYGLCMLTQTVKEYWSAFPASISEAMMLRIQPVQSVTSVEYLDTDGLSQTWDPEEWAFGGYNGATFITPLPGFTWPATWATPNAITVTYQAGFGDTPDALPLNISLAVKLQVADIDKRREDTPQTFTRASENLLRPFYRWAA